MSGEELNALVERLLKEAFDPVKQAERMTEEAAWHLTYEGPWRWYCRICGDEGELPTRQERNDVAIAHRDECTHGSGIGWEEVRSLLHTWRYQTDYDHRAALQARAVVGFLYKTWLGI